MADAKNNKKSDTDVLRAGVGREAERDARAESREVADDKAVSEYEAQVVEGVVDDELIDAGLLKELPEDGAVVEEQQELAATIATSPAPYGRKFEDDFSGKGGTFVIDEKTGDRKRQYEAVRDPKTQKVKGYRPAV
jgi:hypothetical protein